MVINGEADYFEEEVTNSTRLPINNDIAVAVNQTY